MNKVTELRYQRVVLNGFMGAGKSTIGRQLAPLLAWRFLDVDALLVEHSGLSISDLFAQHGEQNFRELEAAFVKQLLGEEDVVIALGGGAVEHAGTRTCLNETPACLIVYLEAPLEILVARCALEAGAAARPVLRDAASLERRFHTRLPWYRCAHLTMGTAYVEPRVIARRIADFIRH